MKKKIKNKFLKTTLMIFLILINITIFSQIWDYNKFYKATSYVYFENAIQPYYKINFNNVNEELLAASIFFYTNKIRIKNNLKPFKYSRFLQLASYGQSKDIAKGIVGIENTSSIINRVKEFSQSGYNIVKNNVATIPGLIANPGTQVEPPVYSHESYKDIKTGRSLQPYTYWGFAKVTLDVLLSNQITKANILNPNLKVLGIGAHIYFYGRSRIPLFKVTQIFADGITDEIDTGDIALLPEPKKLPVLE